MNDSVNEHDCTAFRASPILGVMLARGPHPSRLVAVAGDDLALEVAAEGDEPGGVAADADHEAGMAMRAMTTRS